MLTEQVCYRTESVEQAVQMKKAHQLRQKKQRAKHANAQIAAQDKEGVDGTDGEDGAAFYAIRRVKITAKQALEKYEIDRQKKADNQRRYRLKRKQFKSAAVRPRKREDQDTTESEDESSGKQTDYFTGRLMIDLSHRGRGTGSRCC